MLIPMTPTALLGLVFGGVFSLLYGIHLITDTMRRDAGIWLRKHLLVLTKHPFVAFGTGMGITMLTQSSGATSSLLVAIVGSGLLPLATAIITLLGTDVGSALMAQVLIFRLTDFAFVSLGLGAALALATCRTAYRGIGQVCFGVALVLLGLAALKAGSHPLAGNPLTALVFNALVTSPIVLALIGMALTMIFASSLAGIGLIIVLASNGSLPLVAAIALMLGSNVGSTITAMLTALSQGSLAGRRLAVIHTGSNLALACVGLLLLPSFSSLLPQLPLPPATLVALSHLSFNVVLALVFAPCAVQIAAFIERLIPERTIQTTSAIRSLSPDALSTPSMALGQAMRAVMQMADIFTEMMQISIHAFEIQGREIPDQIEDLDDRLDELNVAIKHYLTSLDEAQMSTGQKQRQIALLYVSTDLEVMGDLIDKQWMRLAHKKWRKYIVFSEQDWHDLVRYHQEIMAVLQHACAALAIQDARLAQNFFVQKKELSALKRTLDLQHLQRVQARIAPSVESSELHLDILSAMLGILSHASTLVHVVQENLSVSLEEESEEISQEEESEELSHPSTEH